MKWICILLLLGNIAYLAWDLDKQTQSHASVVHEAPPVIPSTAKELQLLTELDVRPEANPVMENTPDPMAETPEISYADDATKESSPLSQQLQLEQMGIIKQLATSQYAEGPSFCVTYGPINGQSEANRLSGWLQLKNVQFDKRLSVDEETELFWVYLSSQSDLGTAQQVVDDLKKKGVTDYQLIKSGKFKNAISLGLFSSKDRVNNRLQEINAKGYKPVVVPYHKPDMQDIFWIDALFDRSQHDLEQLLSSAPAGFDSRPIACSEIALATQNP